MLNYLIAHSPLLYLTQSLWRDEVFSVYMAARPISFFVTHLDFEPPFYYLLLHFWTKIFGMSEIAGRSLSLLAFAGATGIIIFWSEKMFKKHWLAWWLPVFFFFNPMLLYYGMELRTYGWYIFFATLALFAYDQRKWKLWTAATVLGFYTHTFLVIVPFALISHYLFSQRKQLFSRGFRSFCADPMIRAIFVVGLCIAPWLVKIGVAATKLRQSWYFPVDSNLITSVLGNLFLGYEGTPWYLWTFTKYLSLLILGASIVALLSKKVSRTAAPLFVQVYVPLIVIIGISFFKPIYVNRYMIAVTIAEVLLIAIAIYAIRNAIVQKITAALFLLFVLGFNVWYPSLHAKTDIRETMRQVKALTSPTDVIMTDSPLVFFETMYYSGDPAHVYLYNPELNEFPWYVGDAIVNPKQIVAEYPPYPIRAFVVHQNGKFDVTYNAPILIKPAK